jgi:long-subunit fatty acid transport protein
MDEEQRVAGRLADDLLGDEECRSEGAGQHHAAALGDPHLASVRGNRPDALDYTIAMLARSGGAILAALLLGAPSASAQGGFFFTRLGSGARAAGMANAFIAISDDGTAASWNPAGLGQLRKPELSVVGTTLGRSGSAEGFRTRDDLAAYSPTGSSYQSTSLDFASLAVPVTAFGKPLTFQAAWRRLYTIEYRENISTTREPLVPEGPPPLQIRFNTDVWGSVDLLSLAGAVKLTPRLALGASFNLWRGGWSEEQWVSQTLLDETNPSEFARGWQEQDVQGENLSLGLLLTFPRWSVGVLHQSPLHSDYRTTLSLETGQAPPAPERRIDGTLEFPRSLGLGGAWRPASRWTVSLDLTWDDWTEAILDTPDTGRVNLFDELPPDRTSTRDTLSLNGGAECLFHGEGFVVPLRFGAAWEPQGGRSSYTRDPVNYVMLAAGTGYNTNSLKFDAALQYRWTSYRDGASFELGGPSSPYLPQAVGERNVSEWRLKFSLILRVTDTEKLRRTVARAFGGGA